MRWLLLILMLSAVACEAAVVEPTATQNGDDDEQAYIETIKDQSVTLGSSLGRFSELASESQLGNQEWTIGVAAELATWTVEYQRARDLTPAAGYDEFHTTWVEALAKLDEAGSEIATGIDTLDADRINRGTGLLNDSTSLVYEALELFNEIQNT